MKKISLQKVNRMRSGQTLFWVEARYNESEDMRFDVSLREKLLLGHKRIIQMHPDLDKSSPWYVPDRAFFELKKKHSGESRIFNIPLPDDASLAITYPFRRWYFTSRRAAARFEEGLRTGAYPEITKMLWDASMERQRRRVNRPSAIRAIGETETMIPFNPAWLRGPYREDPT